MGSLPDRNDTQSSGNGWEWTSDWDGEYGEADVVDPRGAVSGGDRALRGGSFRHNPRSLRAAYRADVPPVFPLDNLGFRVVWRVAGGEEN